jgi:hypothetical protein
MVPQTQVAPSVDTMEPNESIRLAYLVMPLCSLGDEQVEERNGASTTVFLRICIYSWKIDRLSNVSSSTP